MSTLPEEVYYTQELLTEILAAPLARLMQESAEEYILTGKFKPLHASIHSSLTALWDRSMYAGMADAEEDVDNPSQEQKIELSSKTSFSNLIEFAQDPQISRLNGEIKELRKYLRDAQEAFSAKDVLEIQRQIDLKIADIDLIRNPNNPRKAREIAERIRLEREGVRQNPQVQSPRPQTPVSKRVLTTREQLQRDVNSGRSTARDGIIANNTRLRDLLSFDPQADRGDPWGRIFEGGNAKTNAERRLLAMNNLQVYATLNERYPAVGRNSVFAQDYLKYRQSTVATSLEQQYQEQIKRTIAGYVAQERGKPSERGILNRIQNSYQSDKKNRYLPFIGRLQDKYESSKFSRQEYENFLNRKLDEQGINRGDRPSSRLQKLVEEEENLSLIENPNKKQRARMEELEGLIDSLSGPETRPKSGFFGMLERLRRDPNADSKKYINPEARIRLSKEEKEALIKLGRFDDSDIYAKNLADIIRGQKEFTPKQLNNFISILKREGGRFDESLFQIASRTAATEVAAAYSIGRLQVYIERGVQYVQWIATVDTRTSVFCQSLHRKIFAIRDLLSGAMAKQTFPKTRLPEWHPENQEILNMMGLNVWMTPAHPYAYLPNTRVASTGIELLMRKRYVGKTVTIKTETGNTLSVTVEHPILTDRGFVRAGDLNGSEYIFDTFDSQGTIVSNPDYKSSIPTVENLFEFSRVSKSLVRGIVPVPTKDLDSKVSNDKINIVGGTGNLLKNIGETHTRQDLIEILFQRADMGLTSESVDGIFNTIFQSPLARSPGVISRSYHLPSLFGRLPCIEDFLSTDVITDRLTTLSKNAFNNSSLYTKSVPNFLEGHTSSVSNYNDLAEFSRELPSSPLQKEMVVKKTQIVDITIEDYDGFVYHVQDSSGINVANGIIAHNCRSFFSPIYTDDSRIENLDKYPPGGFPPDGDLNSHLLANLIERKRLFEGLDPRQQEAVLQEIVESQAKMRESRAAKLLRIMGNLQDTFNSGLSFLTRKLKRDGVAEFTVDEVQKNDSRLVTALIGGAAVLGTGAMMYFFMKSNLATTLAEYLKTKTGVAVGGLAADVVAQQLRDLIKASKVADKMPQSVKDLLMKEPTNLTDASLGQRMEMTVQNGNLAFNLAAAGQSEQINNLISGGIKGVNRQAQINTLTRSALNSAMNNRRQLQESAVSILNRAFVNSGGAIDPRSITSIQEFANVYRVGIAGKRGTFVGKRAFDSVMGSRDVRQELSRLQSEMNRIERGLDGIESIVDPKDEIGKALLQKERAEQRAIKAMVDSIQTKMANPEFIRAQQQAAGVAPPPEIPEILNQVITEEGNYRKVVDRLFSKFEETLPSRRMIQGFIPENINSVQDLKQMQSILKRNLADIRKSGFIAKNKSYTPSTAARKVDPRISAELLDAAQRAENQARRLGNLGFSYDSNLKSVNDFYRSRVNTEMESLIDLNKRISNRIKELE